MRIRHACELTVFRGPALEPGRVVDEITMINLVARHLTGEANLNWRGN